MKEKPWGVAKITVSACSKDDSLKYFKLVSSTLSPTYKESMISEAFVDLHYYI